MVGTRSVTNRSRILFALILLWPARPAFCDTSDLWGRHGERWSPTSRLPDFSHAGYHSGEIPLPRVPLWKKVTEFGARGDGTTDDTQALQRAIDAFPGTTPGALLIPAGRYRLCERLVITKPYLVLRGEGEGNTVLYGSRGLGPDYEGRFYIEAHGDPRGRKLASVQAKAGRGDTRLDLSSASGIQAGDWILVKMFNPVDEEDPAFNSLGRYLYDEKGGLNKERRRWFTSYTPYPGYASIIHWAVKVDTVSGSSITLARPLRWDVKLEWRPEVWSFEPTVHEVGVEDLTIEFPDQEYRGHHREAGFNGIFYRAVFNGWIRNVTFVDADWGVSASSENPVYHRGGHNTFRDLTFKVKHRTPGVPEGSDITGHYGMAVGSHDTLIESCVLDAVYVHNLQVGSFSNGVVYSNIRSRRGRLDHHGGAPYENLYTDIEITDYAGDLFTSGGNRADEPNAGARSTLWNIRGSAQFPSSIPRNREGTRFPSVNIIGVDMLRSSRPDGDGHWIEAWEGERTIPPNLYQAMRKRRLEDVISRREEGFVSLFDGKTLKGWRGATEHWAAENGSLVFTWKGAARSKKELLGLKLMSTREYSDFILRFDCKLPVGSNNGVAIRSPLKGDPAFVGMEIQIQDPDYYRELKSYEVFGSIYGVVPAKIGCLNPNGQWNREEVECRGRRVKVTLNGSVIVDVDLNSIGKPIDGANHAGLQRKKGHIGFLGHTGPVEFRNIRIRELGKATDL